MGAEAPSGCSPPCRLALEVSGAAAEGLSLSARVSVELEGPWTTEGEQPAELAVATEELLGAGAVSCDGAWPKLSTGDLPAAVAVICCTEVTMRSWEAPLLQYETCWPRPGEAIVETGGSLDSDSNSEEDD